MNLFGREKLIDALLGEHGDGLLLLIGDSGTGKTAVLAELQKRSVGHLAPSPVQVGRAPGSLQSALLGSLAEALAILATDETTTTRVGRVLTEAAKRVRDSRVKDLREAVARHLLGLVRARLSENLGDLLDDFVRSISESKNETLAARINAASDPDVVDQIVSFIAEVRHLSADTPVVLALDDLDRLDDDDLRRLADIVGRLPSGSRLRGSFTTWHAESRKGAEQLLLSGARSVRMLGLDAESVTDWLEASDLDGSLSSAVLAATNGYPVHVQDALELLRIDPRSKTLHTLTPDQLVQIRVAQAWRELDTASQIVTAKLAIYVDPLSVTRICRLLGVDEVAWGVIQLRLIDSGLMISDSTCWFHELRRRAIWDSLLTDHLRAVAADAATNELRIELASPGSSPADLVDFARVAALNSALRDGTPGVSAALEAAGDELAIAAAALELVEAEMGERAIDAETLLRYAREVYLLSGDGVAALHRLATSGLMHVASDEHHAVALPTWQTMDAVQIIAGRAAEDFGRVPIPQIATAVFRAAIHPRLGPFDMAQYGIGAMSLQQASKQVLSLHRRPKDGMVHFSQNEPGIFIRGSYGGVPIYAAVSYEADADRDTAFEAVHGLDFRLWDEPLIITDAVSLPADVVPSLRFARAVSWLDGRDFSTFMLRPTSAHRGLSVDEELMARREVREFIRDRLSHFERLVYGLEASVGYAYSDSARSKVVVEIRGGESIVQLAAGSEIHPMSPYTRLRLTDELGLSRGQAVGRIQWSSGVGVSKDPVTTEIVELQNRVASFNSSQLRAAFEFDEATLRTAIVAAFERRQADARDLVKAVPKMGLSEPPARTTYVVLAVDEPTPGQVPGADAELHRATFPSKDGEHRLLFAMTRGQIRQGAPPRDLLRSLFGVDASSALSAQYGSALYSLPALLGYGPDEVRFNYPTTAGPDASTQDRKPP